MKKFQQKPKDAKKAHEQISEITLRALEEFQLALNGMYAEYIKYKGAKKGTKSLTIRNGVDFFLTWMEQRCQYEDNDKFTGAEPFFKQPGFHPTNLYELFNSLDPCASFGAQWKVLFDPPFLRRLKSAKHALKQDVLNKVVMVARGLFGCAKFKRVGPMIFMAVFYCNIDKDNILVFCVLPERTPSVDRFAPSKVRSYTYNQYVRFMELVKAETQITGVVDRYLSRIATHPDRFVCFEYGEYQEQLSMGTDEKVKNSDWRLLSSVVKIDKEWGTLP